MSAVGGNRTLTLQAERLLLKPCSGTAYSRQPTVVTRSRCPRALIRRTQKPLSWLWNVRRSTGPNRTSRVEAAGSFIAGA